jgi:protein-S-isoprenylcysteine O-methyltransferase Ste14
MLPVLGVLLLILTFLGTAYFQMFVWHPKHPDRAWPWQVWASFGGIALVGAGLLSSSWTLALLGAASWILARLMWDRAAVE